MSTFIISTSRAQWAPLLLAAAWVPALGFLATAKPNVGLSSLAAHDRRRDLVASLGGCAVVLLVCFAVRPDWFSSWRDAIATAPHIQAAVTVLPFGPLLALAARYLPGLRAEGGTRWMGHRPTTPDSLPVIGRSPRRRDVLYAFGHGHTGLTFGPTTGRLIASACSTASSVGACRVSGRVVRRLVPVPFVDRVTMVPPYDNLCPTLPCAGQFHTRPHAARCHATHQTASIQGGIV